MMKPNSAAPAKSAKGGAAQKHKGRAPQKLIGHPLAPALPYYDTNAKAKRNNLWFIDDDSGDDSVGYCVVSGTQASGMRGNDNNNDNTAEAELAQQPTNHGLLCNNLNVESSSRNGTVNHQEMPSPNLVVKVLGKMIEKTVAELAHPKRHRKPQKDLEAQVASKNG